MGQLLESISTYPVHEFFKNSVFVSASAVFGELLSASLVAYAFARLRFPGRNILFMIVLATMMIPFAVTMIPTFIVFSKLKMVGTYFPLILPAFLAPAFSVFMLRQFMMTINPELDEAARVDGANDFVIYSRIILPLSKPALATVAIFSFMANWNDYMAPLIYLNNSDNFTLALGVNFLRSFRGGGYCGSDGCQHHVYDPLHHSLLHRPAQYCSRYSYYRLKG